MISDRLAYSKLCAERVLEGTAAERNRTECFGTASNLVFVQVHAAFRALRGDIHARTALDQVAHGGFQTGGYAACTEGFEYDLGVAEQHREE